MAIDRPTDLPQIVTTFTAEQILHRQSALSAMVTTPMSARMHYPWSRSNGTSIRRNSLTSPMNSPARSVFTPMSAEFSNLTVRTPDRLFFNDNNTPTMTTFSVDGRQSRLAMRSPGYGTTMTLPLRVNTSLPNVQEEETQSARTMRSSSSTNSLIEWVPANATATRTSSTSPNRRLVRSHTPAPITVRSPIRRRPKRSRLQSKPRLPSPPQYHVTVVATVSPRTKRARQAYAHSVEHLRAGLVPLISVSTGLPHPQFPTSLLQYHLLTHEQLDSLARWYHQVTPAVDETWLYPTCIPAWTSLDRPRNIEEAVIDLETKRRRWGRFIGLRGCESPTGVTDENGNPVEGMDLVLRMEREWKRALERADEDARAFEKSWRGRW